MPLLPVDYAEDLTENRGRYEKVFSLLADDKSREHFEKIVNFRISYEYDFVKDLAFDEDMMYMEDFLQLSRKGEVFIDAGGYDGFTSEVFIKMFPEYEAVHVLEPMEENMNKAADRLAPFQRVYFHNAGLYSKKCTAEFSASEKSSRITEGGGEKVQLDTLDNILQGGKASFIKMDIEGAEVEALKGSAETIKKYSPRMAICAYHKIDDFYTITEQVLSIKNDYKVYFRHCSDSRSESVLFFM